ncbi:MAG: DNA primase DnaG [Candidatus Kariarchaeaceae archaeon]|jgi:DNA primase
MGNVKYSDESVKYLVKARIDIDGVVNKSDIVGALFGQTEGLLDRDMEIKHLQRTGRIGRIDLKVTNKSGATKGTIEIPSSLNKIETAIIAATIESVDRVGACTCTITLDNIIDVRKDKLEKITKRAAEIMRQWDIEEQNEGSNISKIVEKEAKRGKIVSFGYENLSAGPAIYNSDEVILVEGRADVSTLMKMGIENTIALGGTNVPGTIVNLCKNRVVTALLDGDRGGDMILKELLLNAEIEYVARAPEGKEIEHLDIKQVTKTLENKVSVVEAEFISDKYSVVDFLKRNKRYKYLDKKAMRTLEEQNGKPQESREPKRSRSSDNRRDSDNRSKSRDRYSSKSKDKSRDRSKGRSRDRDDRDKRRSRDTRSRFPKVPKEMISKIDEVKESMTAIFVNDAFETKLTVSTSEVFNELQAFSGSINSIIIDGVITQRILSLAEEKSVKLVAGARIGQIDTYPKQTQYVTFNKI